MRARLPAAALAVVAATGAVAQAPPVAGQTLNTVRGRDQLVCGVPQGFAGFSAPNSRGEFRGLNALWTGGGLMHAIPFR